jgi:hypothetical protein
MLEEVLSYGIKLAKAIKQKRKTTLIGMLSNSPSIQSCNFMLLHRMQNQFTQAADLGDFKLTLGRGASFLA